MSYKILSFDVGIRNLAYSILEYDSGTKDIILIDWDLINFSTFEEVELKCQNIMKNGQLCNKKCKKYILDSNNSESKIGYCGMHIKKFKSDKIFTLKKLNINKIPIATLMSNLIIALDKIKKDIIQVDEVIIENQPALKNPKMKTIQITIYNYFLIRELIDNKNTRIKNIIQFSASNKLKAYDGPEIKSKKKGKYNINKDLGIEYTKYLLQNEEKHMIKFNNNPKKDDLADSYLQGLYYIKKKFKLL